MNNAFPRDSSQVRFITQSIVACFCSWVLAITFIGWNSTVYWWTFYGLCVLLGFIFGLIWLLNTLEDPPDGITFLIWGAWGVLIFMLGILATFLASSSLPFGFFSAHYTAAYCGLIIGLTFPLVTTEFFLTILLAKVYLS